MALQVHGVGPETAPLGVVIHSAGIAGADMVTMFGLAIPGFRVLAPDRTNYGASPRSSAGAIGRSQGGRPEVAMIDDDAEEIAALLDPSGHLFGYSYGGIVALRIAGLYPQKVRSLALVEPPALQVLPDDPEVQATLERFSFQDRTFVDPDEYWREFMSSAFGAPPIPPEMVPQEYKEASMREQVPWDVPLDLDTIRASGIPTLVVTGDWDNGFRAVARELVLRLAGRHLELQGADHFFIQHWPLIAIELAKFWTENESTSGA